MSSSRSTGLSAALLLAASSQVAAAQTGSPAVSLAEVRKFAEVHLAVTTAHDSADARLAQVRNKTVQAQQMLKEQLIKQIADILAQKGWTDSLYQRRRFEMMSNNVLRSQFDSVYAVLTGAPLPVQAAGLRPAAAPAAPARPAFTVPAGPVGVHLGHVAVKFFDTPDSASLLATAQMEAKTAAQHATMAARPGTTLQAMQMHAGHVINALDPSIEAKGPGKGYGVKKATAGIVSHVELAAKAEGASAAVKTHANHIATAARATSARAEAIIKLAKQVQTAADQAAAANLMAQIASLCDQLTTGADINADGRATWDKDEGGLQQVVEHLTLMLNAEKK